VLSHLKRIGLDTIAYEDGLNSWPISERCRVLLAGAGNLLDSRNEDFGEKLISTLRDLLSVVRDQRSADRQIRALAMSQGIIGDSQSLFESFRQLVRVSKLSDVPVLITGESGTGKELFASALHALDPKRCHHSFIPINCAAVNPGVAESELFGHA